MIGADVVTETYVEGIDCWVEGLSSLRVPVECPRRRAFIEEDTVGAGGSEVVVPQVNPRLDLTRGLLLPWIAGSSWIDRVSIVVENRHHS